MLEMADLNDPFMHQFGSLMYAYRIKSLACACAPLTWDSDYFQKRQKENFLWFWEKRVSSKKSPEVAWLAAELQYEQALLKMLAWICVVVSPKRALMCVYLDISPSMQCLSEVPKLRKSTQNLKEGFSALTVEKARDASCWRCNCLCRAVWSWLQY